MEAGEGLDDATAEDGAVQGAPVVEVRRAERLGIDVDLHERIDEGLKDHAQPDVVGARQWFVAEDEVKDVLDG